jgi:diketogulonate reductase-like aldo/keto reductase
MPFTAYVATYSNHSFQIDSAPIYENEAPCGAAITKSGIPRDQIFYVSKVWPNRMSYENAKKDVANTLVNSGLDYVDLYVTRRPHLTSRTRPRLIILRV